MRRRPFSQTAIYRRPRDSTWTASVWTGRAEAAFKQLNLRNFRPEDTTL
jgi:hypothetical protein